MTAGAGSTQDKDRLTGVLSAVCGKVRHEHEGGKQEPNPEASWEFKCIMK
jgi:hypothetical protein